MLILYYYKHYTQFTPYNHSGPQRKEPSQDLGFQNQTASELSLSKGG